MALHLSARVLRGQYGTFKLFRGFAKVYNANVFYVYNATPEASKHAVHQPMGDVTVTIRSQLTAWANSRWAISNANHAKCIAAKYRRVHETPAILTAPTVVVFSPNLHRWWFLSCWHNVSLFVSQRSITVFYVRMKRSLAVYAREWRRLQVFTYVNTVPEVAIISIEIQQ